MHNQTQNRYKNSSETSMKYNSNLQKHFLSSWLCWRWRIHLFLIECIEHFLGNSKIFSIFFAPCMVIDSRQKIFVMNISSDNTLSESILSDWKKSRKSQVLSHFFYFQVDFQKSVLKSQNFKIWLRKRQIGNPVLWSLICAAVNFHCSNTMTFLTV